MGQCSDTWTPPPQRKRDATHHSNPKRIVAFGFEFQFDDFVGDNQSPVDAKTFVVGINYPSYGCGRVLQRISFADKVTSAAVGPVEECGMRAIQAGDTVEAVTEMSVLVSVYRIPFLVEVSGAVVARSGSAVEGATVSYSSAASMLSLGKTTRTTTSA